MKDRNLQLLRLYVREAIDLGNVQFSQERTDNVDRSEVDTPEEHELFTSLMKRVVKGGSLSLKASQNIVDLINSDKYGVRGSGFFRGPTATGQPLLRGHAFDSKWAKQYLTIPFEQIPKVENLDFSTLEGNFKRMGSKPNTGFKTPFFFRPRRGWSTKADVCFEFASKYGYEMLANSPGEPAIVSILFMYPEDNEPDSLLDFGANVYRTMTGSVYKDEREVLNVKPVVCRGAVVMRIEV